jgi:HEAT repeat protein
MPSPSTDQLLDQVHALSGDPEQRESDERWQLILQLHGRPEAVVFERCARWALGAESFERSLAADILGQLGSGEQRIALRSRSLLVLEQLLGDADPAVLASALIALSHLGAQECLSRVLSLAGHSDGDVRHGVALALLGDESSAAVDALIALSRDDEAQVRDWATFGLGAQIDLDTPALRAALLDRALDEDEDTRAEAISGLVKRGDARVLEPLRTALHSPTVGSLVVEAARDLAAPELLQPLQALRSWWDVDADLLEQAIARCGGS